MPYDPNRRNNFPKREYNPDKEVRYIHSPFSVTQVDTEKELVVAGCDKDGIVTITQTDKTSEEYDEVKVSASLIFKLANMLRDTRKVRYQDREKKTV